MWVVDEKKRRRSSTVTLKRMQKVAGLVLLVLLVIARVEAQEDSLDDEGCACSPDGVSGVIDTGRPGCAAHLIDISGEDRFFCYIEDPRLCPDALLSEGFPGATYRFCTPPPPPKTVLDVLENNPSLSLLRAAVSVAGLDGALADEGTNYTIFAPNNRAFESALIKLGISADQLAEIKPELAKVLLYHVALGSLTSENLISLDDRRITTISSASFPDLHYTVRGMSTSEYYPTYDAADDDDSESADDDDDLISNPLAFWLSGGTEEEYNRRPYGNRYAPSIFIEESLISSQRYFGASVLEGDIPAGNGIVHIIDGVLSPPDDIATVAMHIPRLSIFSAALEAANLTDSFECTGGDCPLQPVTVFAPTNTAFRKLAKELDVDPADLLRNPNLGEILKYHVSSPASFEKPILVGDLRDLEIPTLLGGNASLFGTFETVTTDIARTRYGQLVRVVRQVPIVEGAQNNVSIVFEANIEAFQGVIHIIDDVLLPPGLDDTPDQLEKIEPEDPEELALLDIIAARDDLTIFAAAADANPALIGALERDDFLGTVFAPNNEAFINFGESIGLSPEELLSIPTLTETLLYHVAQGAFTSNLVPDGQEVLLSSITGQPLFISALNETLFVNGAEVLEADISAVNGVLHILEQVITSPLEDSSV